MGSTDLVAGFECSGNRRPLQGLCGNGRWTGVPLRTVLSRASVKADGARDRVLRRRQGAKRRSSSARTKYKVEQQYGRSMPRDRAMAPEPFLAWALNGEPLTRAPGIAAAPARAGLVRRAERQVAGARSTRRRISTSASSRRAGTGRSRAR